MALGQQEIGRRIKTARDAAGLTQPQLARLIDLKHPQSISKYERGETEVPMTRLQRIAEVTKRPMSYFVGDVTAAAPTAEQDDWPAVLERLSALEAQQRENGEALAELLHLVRAARDGS